MIKFVVGSVKVRPWLHNIHVNFRRPIPGGTYPLEGMRRETRVGFLVPSV